VAEEQFPWSEMTILPFTLNLTAMPAFVHPFICHGSLNVYPSMQMLFSSVEKWDVQGQTPG